MVKLIRRFQKPLLTVVVIVVIISFVVLFNLPNNRLPTSDAVAKLYGRNVSRVAVEREGRRFQVCYELRMADLLFGLMDPNSAMMLRFGQPPSDAGVDHFIWNTLVLRHEADALGLTATVEETEEAIKALPSFQTNGAFNITNYDQYRTNRLSHRGLNQADLERLIADQILLDKVRKLLTATLPPSPTEVREQYVEQNQKTEVSFFRLKLEDFKAGVQITDADVAKLFEERKSTLNTPEKRKVKFVAFTVQSEQKPLTGPARAEAMQKLAGQARDFALAIIEPRANFDTAAAKLSVPVQETPLFGQEDPPAELGKSEQAAEAAFRLTKEEPTSDVVTTDNAYYVLQLSGTEPARPLTLEEAKEQLTAQLIQERAKEAMGLKASELRAKIDTEVKAGKTFVDAAQAAGVTLEILPPFSAAERARDQPETSTIKQRVAEMNEGELTEFLETASGGVIAHVDKRLPIDEAAFEKAKTQVATDIGRAKGDALFQDWLRERREAAKLQPIGRG